MAERTFPVHRDDRGELLVVEGDELEFPIRRVFTVVGRAGGAPRGGHRATCTELIVLVCGSATVTLGRAGTPDAVRVLEKPGDSVTIASGDHVDYQLDGAHSVVAVLCDEPYRSPS
ncbi:hypothetical protein ASC64_01360 [Nocardioides sp. Root122]|uniref:WxcM-like domain-containing protein n=1 Tax=Nocardioides TaxID=1839 RepID=UPI0007026C56|nr:MULTISPECIES: WxcM-like domain-containing protein [Nocardioides]KQV77523.1 hypothetical protein ASC64_01360 [Nocardioides sp. Root122]MCK9821951.1 WxcM-like domain-containing protein [Nocardioides cavernae]